MSARRRIGELAAILAVLPAAGFVLWRNHALAMEMVLDIHLPFLWCLLNGAAWCAGVVLMRPLSARVDTDSPLQARFAVCGLLTAALVALALLSRSAIEAFTPLGLIHFLPTVLIGVAVYLRLGWVRTVRRESPVSCLRCGYDLRGTPASSPCPECGASRR